MSAERGEAVEPWGHKLTIYAYRTGPATEALYGDMWAEVNALFPDAHFIGVEIESVESEPKDQGGS